MFLNDFYRHHFKTEIKIYYVLRTKDALLLYSHVSFLKFQTFPILKCRQKSKSSSLGLVSFLKDFTYLLRETEREAETQAQGEAGSPQGA